MTTTETDLWVSGPPGFPAEDYIEVLDSDAMRDRDYRVEACRRNPLLFALLYFPWKMQIEGKVYLSQVHYDMARSARQWARKDIGPGEMREAWIAPRDSGKSTWMLVYNAIWALAYGHRRFIAMFGGTASAISETHFARMKTEFAENKLLRYDFPELCEPRVKASKREYQTSHAEPRIVACRGLDETNLGLNINAMRPDLILVDDPEKDEGNFSIKQRDNRLRTFRQSILGMNLCAVVQWTGTTTAYNCLAHDLVRDAVGESTATWIKEVGIKPHYYPAIVVNEDGTESSLWEAKWPLWWCQEHRGEPDFELNYMNRPTSGNGTLWQQEHILYGIPASWDISRRILWIDPAMTDAITSDYTGFCVAGYASNVGKVAIEAANAIRCDPDEMLAYVQTALRQFPDIREVFVEKNQGAQYVRKALAGLPRHVRIEQPHEHQSKGFRFGETFVHYQRGRVVHAHQFRLVEDQMFAFPDPSTHDDGPDAISGAVNRLLDGIAS